MGDRAPRRPRAARGLRPKLKKWRFADLPIVPEHFRLIPNDDKAKKQLRAIHKLLKDKEIDRIVNACDAGREGELIFAYVYETSGVDKPVQRLYFDDEEGHPGGVRAPAPGRRDEAARGVRALALRRPIGSSG